MELCVKLLVFKLKRPSDSLAAKLIIAISGLMLAAGATVGVIFYRYEENIALRNLSGHARFAAGLVLKSLRRNMLKASPLEIRHSIDEFTEAGDIREISIYSQTGRGTYSSGDVPTGLSNTQDSNALRVMDTGEPVLFTEETGKGGQLLNLYVPIKAEPACLSAACHYHPPDAVRLGVLKARISSEHIEGTSRQIMLVTLGLGLFFIAIISGFLFVINYMLVTRPMATLENGMRRLAEGTFEEPIRIATNDEMGRLARNFNTMAHDIQRYKDKLENWTRELEGEVEKKAAEIQEAQDQLINAEKLASLGRLAAGVAHEINNPLTGIVTFAHLMLERCPEDRAGDREDLIMIIEQADRCTKIVKGLLGFSRKGASEKLLCNINGLAENAYSMVRNQAAFYDIQVAMKFAEKMPHINADPNQIQQVILNLFTNAADAMNGIGQITIETRTTAEDGVEYAEMSFTDTGPGILPEHLDKILEPFFTTKAAGKGTGLGLPVSYGIIKRHGGELFVQSKTGRGTTFIVRLPVAGGQEAGEKPDG
jgi:two-component system NtrC family sensor kinase